MREKMWYALEPEIEVKDIGIVRGKDRHPTRRNNAFWVLVLLQKGQRTLQVDGEPIKVGAGEFFLLPPNTRQEPLELDTHTACFVHFFANGGAAAPPTQVDASKILLPSVGRLPTELDCIAHVRELANHALSPYADRGFLSLQLRALLSLISLYSQKDPRRAGEAPFAEQVLRYIQTNACTSLRAQDYEATFDRSYHHINLLFKKQFGCTVKQYHLRVRMEYAAQMLMQGRSVQQTALDCGFEDYFFFLNSFKRAHGISPAAYSRRGASGEAES